MADAAAAMLRSAFSFVAPAGVGARLSILIFHRVLPARDPLQPHEPTVDEFAEQLRWVATWFNVIPLSEAVHRLESGTLPARPLAITFDDGYADNHSLALPELERLGLPATFFIATGYLDGGRMFNDTVIESIRQCRSDILALGELGLGEHACRSDDEKRRAIAELLKRVKYLDLPVREATVARIAEIAGADLPASLMMTSRQVADLACRGMEVGAHTCTHPILARVDSMTAGREIAAGRDRLQEICGRPISLFAYPNGRPDLDYTRRTVDLVRALGFSAAVSTAHGVARAGADRYQLPRFTPWRRERLSHAAQLWRNLLNTRPSLATA
jgi:peptidoglycan/xylan/chitin deacetylase (PgdA/CDA1 family)